MKTYRPEANAEVMPLDRPFVSEIPKYQKLAVGLNLTALANDTKWNELLEHMRNKRENGWAPSFRFQCIGSEHISQWDAEWWHHLPFPFISVLWFEISYIESIYVARLLPRKIVDHSSDISDLLGKIGFDFQKGADAFRIFGYAPRSHREFKT